MIVGQNDGVLWQSIKSPGLCQTESWVGHCQGRQFNSRRRCYVLSTNSLFLKCIQENPALLKFWARSSTWLGAVSSCFPSTFLAPILPAGARAHPAIHVRSSTNSNRPAPCILSPNFLVIEKPIRELRMLSLMKILELNLKLLQVAQNELVLKQDAAIWHRIEIWTSSKTWSKKTTTKN